MSADFNINVEYPLQPLCPGHGCAALIWRFVLNTDYLPALPRMASVTRIRCLLFGANTPWKRVRLTFDFGTSEASFAIKPSASNITWVGQPATNFHDSGTG